ncbi:MAG: ABC transporter substrate-binding protein [Limnohabitans sp.]|nr:ABC transporter substrate-binding protein [Limnohabitans sp.]
MNKIGLLLPRSTFYNNINLEIFDGLKQALKSKNSQTEVKLIVENIGFGTDKQQIYRAAERLILEEDIKIIVAYIGHRAAQLLRPLLLATNSILVVLDAGAHLPQEYSTCPNIVYHSLHNSLGAWLAAQKAMNDNHTKGGLITGYYDAGYLQTYSMTKGYLMAGGEIVFNHATGFKPEDFTMAPLKEFSKAFPKSALLSLFSADFTQWYFNELKENLKEEDFTVYLSPFALDENILAQTNHPDKKIFGVAAWLKNLDNDENKIFTNTFNSLEKNTSIFSLLAWECASLITIISDIITQEGNSISNLPKLLGSFTFESPRGTVSFHEKTNTTLSPLYEVEVVKTNEDKCKLKLLSKIEDTHSPFETISTLELNDSISAWHNSYTCI